MNVYLYIYIHVSILGSFFKGFWVAIRRQNYGRSHGLLDLKGPGIDPLSARKPADSEGSHIRSDVCIYMYIYVYIYICIDVCIYIYLEGVYRSSQKMLFCNSD